VAHDFGWYVNRERILMILSPMILSFPQLFGRRIGDKIIGDRIIVPNLAKPLSLAALLWLALLCASGAADVPAGGGQVLWYAQPAREWLEALPLGNGLLGAMVFGGAPQERIALNESSFWSGRPHDYNDPGAGPYFAKVRDLVWAGKFQEAERMADAHFYGVPAAQQAYQPLGDLLLNFAHGPEIADYRRELDLARGVASVRYRAGGTTFRREAFVSYPDRVLVVRITADQPGAVALEARLQSHYGNRVTATPGRLVLDGRWQGPIRGNCLIAPVNGPGLRFQVCLAATVEGGTATAGTDCLRIEQAEAVTFVLAAATSYVNYHDITGDPVAVCRRTLAGVAGRDHAALLRRHVADFGRLMGRVRLDLDAPAHRDVPTDQRLAALTPDRRDLNLEALCFQFGRYLLASSSRAGGQPANLQGIWNESVAPPWGSKYTININTEMNYWPAEVCNLAECHQPLFDLLSDVAVTGAETAQVYYHCRGWVAHHNIDLWRGTAPVDAARYGMWPMGGAWLCQHLWEHYAFSGDREFLRRYYPVLKGAVRFMMDLLVEDPRYGCLVTPFSMSPEHGFLDRQGRLAFLSPAPTLDVAILRELFPHVIEASRVLDVDPELRGELEAALRRLPPYRVNRNGYLQEWIEDWRPGDQGHNCSPNFTIYPGCSITRRGAPELADAIERWMTARHVGGGWPGAWDLGVWARLERGDRVDRGLATFVRRSLAPNLHNRGSNQSDASYGFTAAVAEALLQSHAGEIVLLPALPAGWRDGAVRGLRARGGFEVDLAWRDGRLRAATLRSARGGAATVRYGARTAPVTVPAGAAVTLDADLRVGGAAQDAAPVGK